MGPKCYEKETGSLHCNLGGTNHSSCWYRNVTKGIERLQSHLGETEIPIGETDLPRVCGSGYDETRWRRIGRIGGGEFDFWFRSYVDVGK